MKTIKNLSSDGWIPPYVHHPHHEYILITSLNLGGAEKIVSDQLWANFYSKFPTQYTLIVLYEKEKEHVIPPNVRIIRLNGKLENGDLLFQQIAFEKKVLVCHLINDKITNFLFSYKIPIHMVIHNDEKGWSISKETMQHPLLLSLIAVCEYVKTQLAMYTNKPIYVFRHQIKYKNYVFNEDTRQKIRSEFKLKSSDIVIGMVGRICEQKNYLLAIDAFYKIHQTNSHYKLMIVGGFEKLFTHVYIEILRRINLYKLHDCVFLTGFRRDVSQLINAFDIGLNCSYFEGLSMATQEMMGNGLPIVLSNVGGQKEIYDGKNQLDFFDIPIECSTLKSFNYNYFTQVTSYQNLLLKISEKIKKSPPRLLMQPQYIEDINKIGYASHNIWNLINHIKDINSIPLKTAFITANLNLGGAQRSLINLLTHLDKEFSSFEINLILLNQSNKNYFFNVLHEKNISYYLCNTSYDVFDIAKNLFEYLSDNNINQVIFWNVESKIKLILSKLLSSKIKIIEVSPGDYIFNEITQENLFQEGIYHYAKNYYHNIDKFVSKYHLNHKNEYLKQLKKEIIIIPNGVVYNDQWKKTDYFTNLETKGFKFLVCGRIAPSKYIHVILEAFNDLYEINKFKPHKISIDFIGSTEKIYHEYEKELKEKYNLLIETKIINFLGYHKAPESLMSSYDGLIVLGKHQGSPNTVLEAGACNLPIIANDSGGTKEIIIDQVTGILLPETPNAQLLFNAMNDMIKHYSIHREMSNNCHKKIMKQFTMEKMATNYLKIIE